MPKVRVSQEQIDKAVVVVVQMWDSTRSKYHGNTYKATVLQTNWGKKGKQVYVELHDSHYRMWIYQHEVLTAV